MPTYQDEQNIFWSQIEAETRRLHYADVEKNIAAAKRKPLRGLIILLVRRYKGNVKLGRKACIDRWEAGYRQHLQTAVNVLAEAQKLNEEEIVF